MATKRKPLPKRRPVKKKGMHATDKTLLSGLALCVVGTLLAAVQVEATPIPGNVQNSLADDQAALERMLGSMYQENNDPLPGPAAPPTLAGGLTPNEQASLQEIERFRKQYAQAEESGDWAAALDAAHKINPKAFNPKKAKKGK